LWFGSWLLSELAKAAAHAIVAQSTLDSLIFPAPTSPEDLLPGSRFNVPNKILAVTDEAPPQLADAVERAVSLRLHELRNATLNPLDDYIARATADAQIDDLVECYWAGLPFEDETNYQSARSRLEALMAARKTTRSFRPITWGSNKLKSSLDGIRESVIPEEAYPNGLSDPGRKEKIAYLYTRYKAKQGERLSGVDLLKRLGNRGSESRFPSTSHVAALPLLARLKDTPAARDAWAKYITELALLGADLDRVPTRYGHHPVIGDYEGELLFKSRLSQLLEAADPEQLQRAHHLLNAFLHVACDGAEPRPYYGLLLADGDSMGSVIDAQPKREMHRQISSALMGFSGQVRSIVEEQHNGALVYAGGDDVLAFVPLHRILACASTLAATFSNQMNAFTNVEGQHPTLSVGVVVSHHLEPLSDALALVRAAEKKAKSVPGKNALAVTLSKRGGSDLTVVGSWGTLDVRLREFIRLHREEAIPDGAAHELHRMAVRLTVGRGDPLHSTLEQAMRFEAIRILKRKQGGRGSRPIDDETLEMLSQIVLAGEISIEQLADELVIASDFALSEEAIPLAAPLAS
jgi:CRISPR-associated protein Cmr2